MEPDIYIKDKDDVDPPRVLPHVESTNKWMARIDAEWEARCWSIDFDLVSTFEAGTTSWLTVGRFASVEPPSEPPHIGHSSAIMPPTHDVVDKHPLIEHIGELVRPRLLTCIFPEWLILLHVVDFLMFAK